MDLTTYDKATELLNRYRLCETILEYLSDPEAVKGQRYNAKCGEFFKAFNDEMLVVTHELMTKCGEEFTMLNCCGHTEGEPIAPPTEPKEPEFPIGSKVEIVDGTFKGSVGIVMDFDSKDGTYYVKSDFNNNANAFSMWFSESDLKVYVDEPEVPTPENPEEDGGTDTPGEGEQ